VRLETAANRVATIGWYQIGKDWIRLRGDVAEIRPEE